MYGLILLSTCLLFVLAFWQNWRRKHRRMLELAAQVPGPPAWPIIGNSLYFLLRPGQDSNILDIFTKLTNEYGDYMRFWLGPDLNIVVKNPTDIRLLLTSNKVNQKGPVYDLMKAYIGSGILSGGPLWRNYRKIATPSYNKKAIQHYASVFNREADCLTQIFGGKDPNVAFNVYEEVVRITTQCVCQTLMGLSKEDSQMLYRLEEIVFMTQDMYRHIFKKMTLWWLQIPLVYWLSGEQKKENYYKKAIDDLASDIVRRRRIDLEKRVGDEEVMGIVDRYILSGELTEQEIKWETFSLFTTDRNNWKTMTSAGASQEASAKIASGVLMFLAHLPDWQERVYNEIIEVLGPRDDAVSSEQLKHLKYLDMVYLETLRYFAIGAIIQRTVEEEVTINDGKITLPKGTSLVIPIHDLHRDPRYWEDPTKVKPERFLPENVKKRDPNSFVPFSLGPMDCLGRVYATAMIKTLVVKALRKVQFEGVGSLDDLPLEVAISVKAARGYFVKARPRRHNDARIHA